MKCIWALMSFLVAVPVWSKDLLISDDVKINSDELRYYFDDRLPADAKAYSLSQRKTYKEALENIYLIKYFASLAKKEGLVGNKEKWIAELELERVLMKFYIQAYIDKKLGSVDWDALAQEEYLVNKEKYIEEEQVAASHILIKTSGKNKEESRAKAQSILNDINSGADFDEQARKFSEDKGSAKNDGNLGYFERKKMVKPFSDAAFALESKGSVSDLVETIFGFHIIRLNDRRAAGLVPYEDVKGKIIEVLKGKLRTKLHKDVVFEARSTGRFKVEQENVDNFKNQMEAENPLPKLGL